MPAMFNQRAWLSRPWRGAEPDHTVVNASRATIYTVEVVMTSGTRYRGQVKTGRDYRAALDLFYWRICGLMAGRQVCLEVAEGSAMPFLCNVSWDGRESIRVLSY